MTPLVVVDADVLGRQRTGDETYVRNLLRELGRLLELRIAAVTRRPDLVPDGIEPGERRTRVQELRMAWALPRSRRRRLGADLVHTQYALPLRSPCPAVVTVHDVSFAREPELIVARTGSCSARSCLEPSAAPPASSRSPRGRSEISSTSPPIPRTRSASPRTASTRSSTLVTQCHKATTRSPWGRSNPGRTSSRRSRRPPRPGFRSSSPGRRRTLRSQRSFAAAARGSRAT